jgi:hypothetical protein
MEISSAMIKEEERHILNLLPLLLKADRSFRHEISVTLSEIFPTRDEFKQIIEEIRQSREEANRRFEAMERRFEAPQEEANRRFEAMERRFEATERRFEAMERRFEAHREETNRRFEALQKEMREGFAFQGKAIQEMRERFAFQGKAIQEMRERFAFQGKAIQEMREGFAFQGKAIQEMREGFAFQGKAIQDLKVSVGNLEATIHTLGVTIGALGARWGKEAEETLRQTLKKFLLERMEVKEVKEWRGYDKEGIVFDHPGEIQIDLLLKNKKHYLVELKSSAGCGDVYLLLRKAKFYEQETGVKPELIFVAVQMREEGKKLCQELKVRLISYGEK